MGKRLDEQRRWLRAVATATGLSASALAKKAGLAPSTLNKPLNDPDFDGELKQATLEAVSKAAGIPVMQFPGRPRGVGEVESEPYSSAESLFPATTRAAIDALLRGNSARMAYVVRSYALDLEGILPGDIVVIDRSAMPIGGRLVAAEIGGAGLQAGMIIRRYDKPFLLSSSTRGAARPLVVDDDEVRIVGVVETVLRAYLNAA